MAVPHGALSRLWWMPESTPGTFATFSTTRGLRHFFTGFNVDENFAPFDIGGYGNQSEATFYQRSGYHIGLRLKFMKRYSGCHALLDAAALGEISTYTGPAGPPQAYMHSCQPYPTLPSVSFLGHIAVGGDTFDQLQFYGMRVSRCRWSMEAGGPMWQEMDFIGCGMDWSNSFTTTGNLPPIGSGFSPDEPVVQSHHVDVLQFNHPTTPFYLTVKAFSVEIDNHLQQFHTTGSSYCPKPAYRGAHRTIRTRFLVEQDTNWQDYITRTFGETPNTGDTKFGITYNLYDPTTTAGSRRFTFDGDFQHALTRYQETSAGGQFQSIEYQSIRTAVNAPLTGIRGLTAMTWSHVQGPTGWTDYGSIL